MPASVPYAPISMRCLWDTILRTGSDLETESHPGHRQGPGMGGWGGRDSAESVHSRGMGSEAEGSLHCEEVRRGRFVMGFRAGHGSSRGMAEYLGGKMRTGINRS